MRSLIPFSFQLVPASRIYPHKTAERQEIFSELGFRNTDEWVAVMRDGLDSNEYGWIESHADNFAGLVLVPGGLLQREFDKAVDMVTGIGYHDTGSMMFGKYVSNHLQKIFKVSTSVIDIRLRLDKIVKS